MIDHVYCWRCQQFYRCLFYNGCLWGKCVLGRSGIFHCNTASGHWKTLEAMLSGVAVSSLIIHCCARITLALAMSHFLSSALALLTILMYYHGYHHRFHNICLLCFSDNLACNHLSLMRYSSSKHPLTISLFYNC